MRIENVSVPKGQKAAGSVPQKGALEGAKVGDSLKARVVMNQGGSLNLRLADGQLVRARMTGDLPFTPGQEIQLTVGEVEDGMVVLTAESPVDVIEIQNPQAQAARALESDPQLRPYVEQLQSQGMPVTEETVTAMRQIVQQNPQLSLSQAAFLAGNRVSQESTIMEAAMRLLSGQGKTGDMLLQLSALIGESTMAAAPESPVPGLPNLPVPDLPDLPGQIQNMAGEAIPAQAEAVTQGQTPATPQPGAAMSPMEALEHAISQATQAQLSAPAPEAAPAAPAGQPPTWGQLVEALVGEPVPGTAEPLPPESAAVAAEQVTQATDLGQSAVVTVLPQDKSGQPEAAPAADGSPIIEGEAEDAPQTAPSAAPAPAREGGAAPAGRAATQPEGAPLQVEGAMARPASVSQEEASGQPPVTRPAAEQTGEAEAQARQPQVKQPEAQSLQDEAAPATEVPSLAARLARLPAFAGSSGSQMAEFARVLETASREVAEILALPAEEQAEGLKAFVDDMFAKIDRWEPDTPQLVKKARDELAVRLSLVQEALSHTQGGARPQVAEQTHKLMNHLKLLEQIDQFTYVQIPVQQGEQQKTAEMYIYQNKKKSRRIDPENVRILLALDLQNMGRVQAFAVVRGREVSLRLDVERPEWADYFRSQTAGLYSALSESGFKLTENRVQVAQTEVTVENAITALGDFEQRPSGFDLKI